MPFNFLNSTILTIFRFKGTLLRKLLRPLIYITAPTALLCFLYESGVIAFGSNLTLPSLMGAALGVLLVFRNNTAYERWWEARKVLGALVNVSRSFSMQAQELLPSPEARKQMLALIIAFGYALKEHLREGVRFAELQFLPENTIEALKATEHRPNAIAQQMVTLIQQERQNGLTEYTAIKLIDETEKLVDILGKCERIRKTPMPSSHNYLLKFYVFFYTLTMPFTFIGTLHWWSILAVAIIYFVSMSLVIIAEEIEEPFGRDPNDLPVDSIVHNIHKNINELYLNRTMPRPDSVPFGEPKVTVVKVKRRALSA